MIRVGREGGSDRQKQRSGVVACVEDLGRQAELCDAVWALSNPAKQWACLPFQAKHQTLLNLEFLGVSTSVH